MGVRFAETTVARVTAGAPAAVFLDRDGVLTRSFVRAGRPYAPRSLHEFTILPGTEDVLVALRRAGFLLIVVTNQPDVGRGLVPREAAEEMHRRLRVGLPIDDIFSCYCLEEDEACECYKPRPGMLLSAASKWSIDLSRSFIVGDRWRDIGAGKAAGCKTVFLDRGYSADRTPEAPDATVRSLEEARDYIINLQPGG